MMSSKPGESTVDPCNIRKLKIDGAHNWKKNEREFCPAHRSSRTKCLLAENIFFKTCINGTVCEMEYYTYAVIFKI